MGVYNTLHVEAPCPACRDIAKRYIQFKYGNSRMHNFELGQRIWWGGNNRGTPWDGITLTRGIAGPCEKCGAEYLDYVIELRGGQIVAVWPRNAKDDAYWPDLDANYAIHFDLTTPVEERTGRRSSLRTGKWTTDDYASD